MTAHIMTEAPKTPAFNAKQSVWNTYFKNKAKWEAQQARLAQGLPAVEKKPRDYITVKELAAKFKAMGEERIIPVLEQVAKKYGIKTVRLNAITFQAGGTTLTNWEDDHWTFHDLGRNDDKTLEVKTDNQNSMHAGSNKHWGIGEARTFPAGTTAFCATYRYASSGPAYSLRIVLFTNEQKALPNAIDEQNDFDAYLLNPGK